MQAVDPHDASGKYLMLRFGRQRREPFADHLRRTGEEAVLMRIIGRPHDFVRPDIVGQHGDAVLDRLERDPAIPAEELLGRVFGAVSLKPGSSKCRSMRSSHGTIQPPPDSRNATTTPLQITPSPPASFPSSPPVTRPPPPSIAAPGPPSLTHSLH